MKKTILAMVTVLLLALVALAGEQYYRLCVSNLTSRDGGAHLVYIYPDTPVDSLLQLLSTDFETAAPRVFAWHAHLMKFRYPRPGCYRIGPRTGDLALIRKLRGGEQTPVEVTFNHIRTRAQLAARLGAQLMLDSADIASRLEDDSYMSRYALNKATAVSLFLPDTYEMYWTISPDALFERMDMAYHHFWNIDRQQKAKRLGLSRTDVATLASIAEEETNKDFEYPIIAGLYYNRLRKGMPLQACPTVKFALQDFSLRRILNEHLKTESPYNTYRNKGLPPGPIRIPRASTMDAVLNMQPSNYLYMCASADFNGTHHFSATYAEHARYARQYQAELNRRGIR